MENGSLPINPIANLNNHVGPMGLTKREYFAAMALNGILSNNKIEVTKDTSELAVMLADQLLTQLEK